MSRQVAPPALMTKPACFSETCAPPTLVPFRPHCSISPPAKCPTGRLNVLPALGYSKGCLDRRRWARSAIFSRMAVSLPVAKVRCAPTMLQGSWEKTLVR